MYKNCKNYLKNIRKIRGFGGPFEGLSFITSFSCVHGGTRFSHNEIEFRKNSKTYKCALKKTLFHFAGSVHLRLLIWKIFISPR